MSDTATEQATDRPLSDRLDEELPDLPGPAFVRRFQTHFPGVPCVFRAGSSDALARQLAASGVIVVSPSIPPATLANRLWEVVAFEEWVEA